jgi:hypothetical protein
MEDLGQQGSGMPHGHVIGADRTLAGRVSSVGGRCALCRFIRAPARIRGPQGLRVAPAACHPHPRPNARTSLVRESAPVMINTA